MLIARIQGEVRHTVRIRNDAISQRVICDGFVIIVCELDVVLEGLWPCSKQIVERLGDDDYRIDSDPAVLYLKLDIDEIWALVRKRGLVNPHLRRTRLCTFRLGC